VKAASGVLAPHTLSVVGAPMHYGQPLLGTEQAPAAIRGHNGDLRKMVTSLGWRWCDRGDVEMPKPQPSDPVSAVGGKNAFAVGKANENLARVVSEAANDGHFVLTLGGDHSVAIGSIAGLLRAKQNQGGMGIVWVDAHADINAPDTSPSGNIHGMPLSFLLRIIDASQIPGSEWLLKGDIPALKKEDLVYIGLRDLDQGEKKAIKKHGIKAFTMHDIDKYGIGKVMEMALDHVQGGGRPERPLHLSYDIDGVDPSIAPSTGTTVSGGLSYREAHFVAEACARTGLLGSMDLVEINPRLGKNGFSDAAATVQLGVELIGSALGKDILEDAE
jgi:arginase